MTQQNEESSLVMCQPCLLPSDFDDRDERPPPEIQGNLELISPTSLYFPTLESPVVDLLKITGSLSKTTYPRSKPGSESSNADSDNQRARNRTLRDIIHFDKERGSKFQFPKGSPIFSRVFC